MLSERDCNRESISNSNTTENDKIFNLTPEMMQDLCKANIENLDPGKPPKASYVPFEIEGNEVSFQRRSSSKGPIKIKQRDGSFKSKS